MRTKNVLDAVRRGKRPNKEKNQGNFQVFDFTTVNSELSVVRSFPRRGQLRLLRMCDVGVPQGTPAAVKIS